ncbi:hypothetical protein SUGI_0476130 [Cryptomeria japonica]|nr:hypothetical protein SUGI_0476130 [Cryptomeria japonica]
MSSKYLNHENFYRVLPNQGFPIFSKIWKNILKCKNIVQYGLLWLIGNGGNINFWDDTWLGDKPLDLHHSCKNICDGYKVFFGHWVSDHITPTKSWKDISQCYLDRTPFVACGFGDVEFAKAY